MPFAQKPSILRSLRALAAGETEVDALTHRPWNRRDLHDVSLEIKAGLNEKPAKPKIDPRCCPDTATLHDLQVSSPRP
jgi:hypothetical protein